MSTGKRIRASVFLFIFLILSIILAACSPAATTISTTEQSAETTAAPAQTTDPSQSQTSTTEQTDEQSGLYIEGSEGVTLTYWIPIESLQAQNFTTLAEHPYFIWLEEQTGVKIEFIHPSWEQMEQQLSLMIASNKFYDLLYYAEYPGGPQAGIDENCFVDLNPYLDQYMPEYKAAITCDDGSFGAWEWGPEKDLYQLMPQPAFHKALLTFDGSLWCVSQVWTDSYPVEAGPVIRKDWLDEAGLDIPETLQELEIVLAAFKERGDDIIPMNLGQGGLNNNDGSIITAFDLYGDWFTMTADKKTIRPHTYVGDNFLDYLTLMNDWYEKGYIDPDFMNRDPDALDALFLDDRLGVYTNQFLTTAELHDYYSGEQDFEVAYMPIPRQSKDQQLLWASIYDSAPVNYTCLTSSCEYPEVAAQWLNVGFKKEAILRHTYGIEGETYELKDDVPYYLPAFYEVDHEHMRNLELFPNSSQYFSSRVALIDYDIESVNVLSSFGEASKVWSMNSSPDLNWVFTIFEDDTWGDFETKLNDAKTYADPMVLKFITGAESLDKFDEFYATASSMGLDEARDRAQVARDKMQS